MAIPRPDRTVRTAFRLGSGSRAIFDIVGRLDPRNPKAACEPPKAMR